MKNRYIYSIVIIIFSLSFGFSQEIVSYSSVQNSACSGIVSVNANASAAGVCRGSGISQSAGGTYNSNGWTTSAAENANDYLEWSLTPNAGFAFNLTSMDIRYDRSNSGPRNAVIKIDTGAGFTTIFTDTSVSASGENNTINLSAYTNLTNIVTFRLYVYNANLSGGTFDIEQRTATNKGIIINGAVVSSGPTISVAPTSLTGFNYEIGTGPSGIQTFTAEGTSLTAPIIITAPTDYEIATTLGGPYSTSISLPQTGGVVNTTTIYVRLKAGLVIGLYAGNVTANSTGATTQNIALDGQVTGSNNSDIIKIVASEAVSISSLINNPAPLNATQGVQVWQFKVRDGGAALNDADNLPTILTAFNLLQAPGNSIGTWLDAIETIALFDGATFIATGTVTPNQIQFSGLNVSVADNTEKTLSLRLSLKCPLGADAFDGEDFVFSLSNANVTFASSGSGKFAFPAQQSANGQNIIDVVATQLTFVSQPTNAGVNSAMSNVVIGVTDVCGNNDTNFSGNITLTSTGTMTGNPLSVTVVSGQAVFSGIIHTAAGTGLTMDASATGLSTITSVTFDISDITTYNPGELIFVGYDGQVNGFGATDEYLVATLVDLIPGTTFSIVNSRYEAGAAANVRTDKWGGGGNNPSQAPYEVKITYNGPGNITAGSIMQFRTNGTSSWINSVNVITGTTISNRTIDFTGLLTNVGQSPNISTSGPDQIYLMQGDFVFDGTNTANQANYTLNGTLLHGLTNRVAWVPLSVACSGSSASSGNPRESRLPSELTCFNVESTNNSAVSGYYENDKEHGIATLRNIVLGVSDVFNNWTLGTGRYTLNPASNATNRAGKTFLIGASNPKGQWVGDTDANWFNCANWEGLSVPTTNTNVTLNGGATFNAIVDYTATYSDEYNDIAVCNNMTILGNQVELTGNNLNILEVHGDLLIDAPAGALSMDDNNAATLDGQLYLYGNWTNNMGNTAFKEGNGTVIFSGNTPQVINNVTPRGTEEFYNVTLDNNFNTGVSNDLYLNGSLVLNPTKTLDVQASNYVRIQNDLTNNGTLEIRHEGSLVQVNDAGLVNGAGTTNVYKITSTYIDYDYIYWSSPVQNETYANVLSGSPQNWIFTFNTANFNDSTTDLDGHDDEDNDWDVASGVMPPGVGCIAMGEGSFTVPASNPGSFTLHTQNAKFTAAVNNGIYSIPTVQDNDLTDNFMNQHLVGNPYPSAIDGHTFLTDNTAVVGSNIYLWTHRTVISNATPGNRVYNFTNDDYATINLSGGAAAASGGAAPSKYIASGQSFLVDVKDAPAGVGTPIVFNNGMRVVNENTHFLRTSNANQKDRLWLKFGKPITNLYRQILIAFFDNTTTAYDDKYDGERLDSGNSYDFYSLIDNTDKHYAIQALSTFNDAQKVALGFESYNEGDYSIGIDQLEGVFNTQDIFLEDTYLNVIHDLKQADYVFTSTTTTGDVNDRFILRFTNNVLNVDQDELTVESLIISEENSTINIHTSLSSKIKTLKGYDILGRLLIDQTPNTTEVNLKASTFKAGTLLIFKVQLEDQTVLIKKYLVQ